MLSFRQKIFLSYVIGFLLFLLILFPLSSYFVRTIVESAMEARSTELINRIKNTKDDEDLIKTLRDQKQLIFFRVSVISNTRNILYDSHVKRLLGPLFTRDYIVRHPEVEEAFDKGMGYKEDWSEMLSQKFAYMAMKFDFHGKPYVLRTAFPYSYVREAQKDFEWGFLALAILLLMTFSLMSWLILNHFTKPIQRVIDGVKPYQENQTEVIPFFELDGMNPKDEFSKLASTLNSLNLQIQNQLNSAKLANHEKEILLESLIEGVVAVDPQGVITFANQSALNFFDLKKEDLISKTFKDVGQLKCDELAAECQAQNQILNEPLELTSNHKTLYLNILASPKRDQTGALLVFQDTTQEVKILEMRKDFIANASHELKTPITIIQGFAEILHDNPDIPKETASDLTSKIVKNCVRMTSLIKDLLALADIENLPPSRLHQFDIFDILQKAKNTTLEVFKEANITLHGQGPLLIVADPDLMEMAFLNLINNAAKYSHPPAQVDVFVQKNDQDVVVKVQDHGIGIPKADLPHLFERFYRVDIAHSKKLGGSGLGLSIVQTVAKKHQGRVEVQSTPDKGSVFTMTLPINKAKT